MSNNWVRRYLVIVVNVYLLCNTYNLNLMYKIALLLNGILIEKACINIPPVDKSHYI